MAALLFGLSEAGRWRLTPALLLVLVATIALDTLGGEHEEPTLSVLKRHAGARFVSVVHPLIESLDRFDL